RLHRCAARSRCPRWGEDRRGPARGRPQRQDFGVHRGLRNELLQKAGATRHRFRERGEAEGLGAAQAAAIAAPGREGPHRLAATKKMAARGKRRAAEESNGLRPKLYHEAAAMPISDDVDPDALISRLAGLLAPPDRIAFRSAAMDALSRVPCWGEGAVYRAVAVLQRQYFNPPPDRETNRPLGLGSRKPSRLAAGPALGADSPVWGERARRQFRAAG